MTKIICTVVFTLVFALLVGNSYGKDKSMNNGLFCGYFSIVEFDIYRIIVAETEIDPKKDVILSDDLLDKINKLPYVEENPNIFQDEMIIRIAFSNSKEIWKQAGSLYYSVPLSNSLKNERYKKCMLNLAGTGSYLQNKRRKIKRGRLWSLFD